jgi:hypothetical protein
VALQDYSLKKLKELDGVVDAKLSRAVSFWLVETYDEFITCVYNDLDSAITDLQENRHLVQDDGEDRLTANIISYLKGGGHDASHDTQLGGHTDILVRYNNFVWICEAKIHKDYDYLYQGFNQLCTRYTYGVDNSSNGSLLVYIHQANAKNVMQVWQSRLENKNVKNLAVTDCTRNSLAFYSEHDHQVSGNTYKVRHIPVLLHFDPQDRK